MFARREPLGLKSQHCRLNTDYDIKVITRTTAAPRRFVVAPNKVVNKRHTGVILLVVLGLPWIVFGLLSGLFSISPLTQGSTARIVLGWMLKSGMSIYSKKGPIIVY